MNKYKLQIKTVSYFFLLLVIVIFNISCKDSSCPVCYDSNDWNNGINNIKGSGNIVSEERILPFINSINHATVGQVNITYGETQQVIVKTDDNIQKYIKTDVLENKLNIYIDSNSSLTDFSLTIDIVLTELKSLATNSAGNIFSTNKFFADDVYIYLNSAGNINLNIETTNLHSNISSAGNLILAGKAINHYSGLYSAGNLNAYNLETDTTHISVNSAGNAFVHVDKYLDAILTSLGSVYYIGYPQISQHTGSIGKVVNTNS